MDRRAEAPLFVDRVEAGRRLAELLAERDLGEAVVVGLARGGVVLAAEIAATLGLPLDALAVRKVGHPAQPEYAVGAVTPAGGLFLRESAGPGTEALAGAVDAARGRARELDAGLHADHPALDPSGRTVVLVDDGLATGATMVAAVRWARSAGAARVVAAVPVGPPDTVAALAEEADEVVCPEQPELFLALGHWYERFGQVADEDVLALLDAAAGRARAGARATRRGR
ncbi:MAG TPA: phosphoribosyltransferase family protein [Gaiellaceae bacterium]|nr:phosphoribosyltransferase family protein [Gaiellaceae bacterium]